jgi:hypothetical protein
MICQVLIPVFYPTPKNGKKLRHVLFSRPTMRKAILVTLKNQKFFCFTVSFYVFNVPGFFSYNNKKYGQFFCAVQTFTGKVFAVPIRNVKTKSLIDAIQLMTKVT